MEFKDHAATETSALVGQVLAASAANSIKELETLRRALDAAIRHVETSLKAAAVPHDAELSAAVEKLSAAADQRAEAARRQALDEAGATIQALQRQLQQREQQVTAAESARRQLADEARAKIEALQKEATKQREQQQAAAAATATLRQEAKASRERIAALEQESSERAAACRDLEHKLDGATAALTRVRAQAENGEQECVRLREEVERSRLAAAEAARVAEQSEALRARDLAEHAQKWREHALTFLSLSFDRLLAVYDSVASGATGIDDVFGAVLDALAVEFSRVALFKVKRNRLEGVRQTGFDFPTDMSHVAIPRTIDSLLTRAVASGQIETLSASDLTDASGTPFGGTPATVLALPITIGGEPCAVVYADDADQPHRDFGRPELRTKFAELVCEHAAPLLLWLSTEEQALAELREYATLLLTELEYTWAGDVSASRPESERRRRLADSLECARGLFAERARSHGARAAALFDERLTVMVGARMTTPFGRDLALLVDGQPSGRAASPQAAEAS